MVVSRSISKIICLTILCWSCCPYSPILAESRQVEVTGRAYVIGSGETNAKSAALKDAFRTAVEQEVGVWVQSHTEVKNAVVVEDKISTNAQGYVTLGKVVREGVEGDFYVITIKATVSLNKIQDEFENMQTKISNTSKLVGDPGIAIVVSTWGENGERLVSSDIIDALEGQMIESGFRTTTKEKAQKYAIEIPRREDSKLDVRNAVRSLATKDAAKLVVRGEMNYLDIMNTAHGIYTARIKTSIELVGVDNDDILGKCYELYEESGNSKEQAESRVMKRAAAEVGKSLSKQALSHWQEITQSGTVMHTYMIEVINVTSARKQRIPFVNTLKELECNIIQESYPAAGIILFEVTSSMKKDELAKSISDNLMGKTEFDKFDQLIRNNQESGASRIYFDMNNG